MGSILNNIRGFVAGAASQVMVARQNPARPMTARVVDDNIGQVLDAALRARWQALGQSEKVPMQSHILTTPELHPPVFQITPSSPSTLADSASQMVSSGGYDAASLMPVVRPEVELASVTLANLEAQERREARISTFLSEASCSGARYVAPFRQMLAIAREHGKVYLVERSGRNLCRYPVTLAEIEAALDQDYQSGGNYELSFQGGTRNGQRWSFYTVASAGIEPPQYFNGKSHAALTEKLDKGQVVRVLISTDNPRATYRQTLIVTLHPVAGVTDHSRLEELSGNIVGGSVKILTPDNQILRTFDSIDEAYQYRLDALRRNYPQIDELLDFARVADGPIYVATSYFANEVRAVGRITLAGLEQAILSGSTGFSAANIDEEGRFVDLTFDNTLVFSNNPESIRINPHYQSPKRSGQGSPGATIEER